MEKQGVQLIIDTIPQILERIPDFRLVVIGGGPYLDRLRSMAEELGVHQKVEFTGIITSDRIIESRLELCGVGLAPYDESKDTWTYYADPGKIREYMAAGLPVVMTELRHNSDDLRQQRCAIIIGYDSDDAAKAIIKLLKDERLLREYRTNAIEYSRSFDWNVIFDRALMQLNIETGKSQ